MNYVHSEVVMNNRLSEAHVDSWRERGFALVHDLLPTAVLHELKDDAAAFYPEPDTDAATHFHDFGSGQKFVFPAESNACNSVTLHPLLLQAVGDLLGVETTQLRLTQSDLWPKYGLGESAHALDNTDQRIHCDYPNHSLVHPPEWHRPEAVEIIIEELDSLEQCPICSERFESLEEHVAKSGHVDLTIDEEEMSESIFSWQHNQCPHN